jgi:hypothetical protein
LSFNKNIKNGEGLMSVTKNNITELVMYKLNNIIEYKNEILKSLHILLNGNYMKYDIEGSICSSNKLKLSDESFQNVLAHLNEKSDKRKTNGVYYTPNDVTKYIIANAFINRFFDDNTKTYNFNDCISILNTLNDKEINELLYNTKIIDPTCGTGEFLVSVFELKYLLLKDKFTDDDILNIVATIYGNDIDEESNDISKIRLFFCIANKLSNYKSFFKLAEILKGQFFNVDFVASSNKIKEKFDIIIGNPPYVEYGKYPEKEKLNNNFGNIYADVIKNSIDKLNEKGIIGYIIPLSYTSTNRMKSIRDYVIKNMKKQFILNFADRPDCLFNGVHQKLNILIAQKGENGHTIYTSNYKHWYKDEREQLLNGRDVIECEPCSDQFIPKIGNSIEKSIFRKIYTQTNKNIYDYQSNVTGKSIFLNMRACFWIKAFSFNPGSNEYKDFKYDEDNYYFIECLLNSSLFWIYWTIVSDCWHITTKELKSFYIPEDVINKEKFKELAKKLEDKLEKTKKYVGTKQVDYEYKHKCCKDIIDEIDEELAIIYGLCDKEKEYIKSFAITYRVGGNND